MTAHRIVISGLTEGLAEPLGGASQRAMLNTAFTIPGQSAGREIPRGSACRVRELNPVWAMV